MSNICLMYIQCMFGGFSLKVFLVGKERSSGNRRDGSSYDNIFAFVNFQKRSVEGVASEKVLLSPRHFPFQDLIVGAEYEMDRNDKGYVDNFELV